MGQYFSEDKKEDNVKEIEPPERRPVMLKKIIYSPRNPGVKFNFFVYNDISGIEKLGNYGVLPLRNLNKIFMYCTHDSILECSCSCRLFYRVIHCTYFWKNYYLNIFPKYSRELESKDEKQINWKKLYFQSCYEFENKDEFYQKLFFTRKTYSRRPVSGRPYDVLFKFAIFGDMGVGKTSLLQFFSEGTFYNAGFVSAIGVDFKIRTACYDNQIVKLQIWDTCGQERFFHRNDGFIRSYYKGINGALICFSIDAKETFENVLKYVDCLQEQNLGCPMIIVGCKCDLEHRRVVNEEMIKECFFKINEKHEDLGISYNRDYCECSSRDLLFRHLAFGMLLEKTVNGFKGQK